MKKGYEVLSKEIEKKRGSLYIVGGEIRDSIIEGRKIGLGKNIDLEVMGISKEDLEKIFDEIQEKNRNLKGKGWRLVGKTQPIYLFQGYEIKLSKDTLIRESVKKRDLTINGLYYNIEKEKIIDLVGGIDDIKRKKLRLIDGEYFFQDPLRIFRVAELKGRLGFDIEENLLNDIKKRSFLIKEVAIERIEMELEKILLTHKLPSKGIKTLDELGVLKNLFPIFEECKGIEQEKEYHPEGDVWTHTLMTLDVLKPRERSYDIMLTLLFHDIGKVTTIEKKFKGHPQESVYLFEKLSNKVTKNKKLREEVKKLIRYHASPLHIILKKERDEFDIKKLSLDVDLLKLLSVYRCDVLGRGERDNTFELEGIEWIKKVYKREKDSLTPLITGKELLKVEWIDKKDYKEILNWLHLEQLKGRFSTIEKGLKYLQRNPFMISFYKRR